MTKSRQQFIWIAITIAAIVGVTTIGLVLRNGATVPSNGKNQGQPDFTRLTNEGRSALENLNPQKAVTSFEAAAKANPGRLDAQLNLANAYLQADRIEEATHAAEQATKIDPKSAAAYYILGSAHLRLARFDPALAALQQAKQNNPAVTATHFQLGRAYQGLAKWGQAAKEMRTVIEQEPEHPAAHYILSQVLIQLGDRKTAEEELTKHQAISATQPDVQVTPATFERSIFTMIQVPSQLTERPEANGIAVRFTDVTEEWLKGEDASGLRSPIAAIDFKGDGKYSVVAASAGALRLLKYGDGHLLTTGATIAIPVNVGTVSGALVGDLQNDGVPDLILLGDHGSAVFSFSADGKSTDVTGTSGLASVAAAGGVLADLDFTGKLGLWTISPDGSAIHPFRNNGKMAFKDLGPLNAPAEKINAANQLFVDDWNRDDLPDLFIARSNSPPSLLQNRRNGPMGLADPGSLWPAGAAIAVGDVDNDLRSDLVVAASDGIQVVLNGSTNSPLIISTSTTDIQKLYLIDFDNDGWLDIVAAGKGIRAWRNLGSAGFKDVTDSLGLAGIHFSADAIVKNVIPTDLDSDGDTDLLLDLGPAGLRVLRNDGGNANHQTKFRLAGKRSNSNGLGTQLELSANGWQTIRTFTSPTLEVGHGKHASFDTATMHWFDLVVTTTDVKPPADKASPVVIKELELPTGSCPYLYAWDGKQFRFITDILGAAPLGLRITDDHFIDADTEEFVRIGDETTFVPRDGKYVLQITEELREVLYLDRTSLLIADHPAGTEVHSTSKLLPGKPFPRPELMTLGKRIPLRHAETNEGLDVTAALQNVDEARVSPPALRVPQLRGLAEPHSITLEFETFPANAPLTLALTGWLRFGGGMANVAASHDKDLPFPFPTLEAKTPDGWKPLDVIVGAPAGKTKTIVVDLTNKVPPDATALRLSTAFEIHWDRIALFGEPDEPRYPTREVPVERADLHWHGFGRFETAEASRPLTPIFDAPAATPPWLITPTGWCTRYGDVKALITETDNALVLINGGDALELTFDAPSLPPKPAGAVREFFLNISGWDKDADYHVEKGATVGPLPWHGMNDQRYGLESRPTFINDAWMEKFNTRWVPARTNRSR